MEDMYISGSNGEYLYLNVHFVLYFAMAHIIHTLTDNNVALLKK